MSRPNVYRSQDKAELLVVTEKHLRMVATGYTLMEASEEDRYTPSGILDVKEAEVEEDLEILMMQLEEEEGYD
jgi:hypothetical protein